MMNKLIDECLDSRVHHEDTSVGLGYICVQKNGKQIAL